MNVTHTTDAVADLDADLLIVPLPEDPDETLIDALAARIGDAVRRPAADFDGKAGSTLLFYPDAGPDRAVLVGIGTPDDDADDVRHGAAAGASVALKREAEHVACLLPNVDLSTETSTQAMVEGVLLGAYRYRRYKTDDDFAGPADLTVVAVDETDAVTKGIARGRALADAACSARDLVNTSPHDKTAKKFAKAIAASGKAHGYDVETWDEDRIREENFGGLLAVNQGSFDPPSMSVLTWAPDDAVNEKPIVLVGKGVVFDTGGLSLKPTKNSMDFMKADMGGAAAVVGAFEALADLDVPLHVIGLVPATDNRPGNKAYVPGDVVTMHSGATVEVMNTDAEGRMLLADALSYAKSFDPELVIDLATLTGAQVVALGTDAAAVMTSETDGAAGRLYAIQRAGERSGERVHPLPMYDVYKKQLDSPVADIKNVGGREAGSITAGKFLEHFVDDAYPWLHLDIAGPAFLQSDKPYRPKGGTGFGVRLLGTYLLDYVTSLRTD